MSRRLGPRVGAVLALLFTVLVIGALPAGARQQQPADAALGALGAAPSVAGFASMDGATRYDVSYDVDRDGGVAVTQTIEWQWPAGQERHGIYRDVQVRAGYQNLPDRYRYYELSDVRVSSPTGAPTNLQITDQGATQRLRIGSPDITVSGRHTYVVSYRLANVVNDIGDGTAEFYTNLVDTSNSTVMQQVTARVSAPVAGTRVACFYGPAGATDACTATAGLTSTFAVPDLAAYEGASLLVSYPRSGFGAIAPDIRTGAFSSTEPFSRATIDRIRWALIGLGVLVPLLTAAGLGTLVATRGRDERFVGLTPGLTPGLGQDIPTVRGGRRPAVTVQFNPPAGAQPGLIGTVLDERADTRDVTATLIDLAVRGHVLLSRPAAGEGKADDWQLTRLTPTKPDRLLGYEQQLLDGIFGNAPQVLLSDLREKFYKTNMAVTTSMDRETVRRGWFARSPHSVRLGWRAGAVGVAVVAAVLLGVVAALFGDRLMVSGLGIGAVLVLVGGLMFALLIALVLGGRMPARTALGSAMLDQSLGFKQYLKTAEANQIRWEEAQDLFSRFLPYAIVFGVESRWAEVFEQVAQEALARGEQVLMPTWYVGPSTFTFSHLTSEMTSFGSSAAAAFVSTPSSSGSSGFSSGGGFSGGGSFGSSGGSW